MRKRLLPLSTLSLLLVLGCAGEQPAEREATIPGASVTAAPADTAATHTPPCSWITEAEATEALGQPSKYRNAEDEGSSSCIIDPVTEGSGISVDFQVTDDQDAWKSASDNATTISGLGDVAVWNPPTIAVKKGDRYLIAYVSRMGAPEGDLKTPAIAFAQKIVPKM